MPTTDQFYNMANLLTRRRCWGLTTLPFIGLGVTAFIEYFSVPQTEVIRAVLAFGFLAVLIGSGAAFVAWGNYLKSHGRPRLGTTLERGVVVVFSAWIGWSLLAELTQAIPTSVAMLEALIIGTSIVGDAYIGVLLTQFNLGTDEVTPRATVRGMLTSTLLFVFSALWLLFSHHWTTTSLGLFVIGLGILGVQLVRLKTRSTPM